MLKQILTEGNLGMVIGEADSGVNAQPKILSLQPDIVLIDLLMPELDGIETVQQLKEQGFGGQFVMLSQVVNKEMVGEAYEVGVEFFIHKPINRIEVQSILHRMNEQSRLKNSLQTIRESLAHLSSTEQAKPRQTVKETVLSILSEMGIVGEAGSGDLLTMMELLLDQDGRSAQLPPLKELYEETARRKGLEGAALTKESKAIEQRIRRTVAAAMEHLASLGAVDYTIEEFEYYAPRFFDFPEINQRMKQIQDDQEFPLRPVKVNSKKFLQALYLETMERQKKFT